MYARRKIKTSFFSKGFKNYLSYKKMESMKKMIDIILWIDILKNGAITIS